VQETGKPLRADPPKGPDVRQRIKVESQSRKEKSEDGGGQGSRQKPILKGKISRNGVAAKKDRIRRKGEKKHKKDGGGIEKVRGREKNPAAKTRKGEIGMGVHRAKAKSKSGG